MSSLPVTSESEPSAYVRFQRRTQQVLSVGADADPLSQAVDVLLILLILGNIAAVVIETVSWIATEWGRWLRLFEIVSVLVFTIGTTSSAMPSRRPFRASPRSCGGR